MSFQRVWKPRETHGITIDSFLQTFTAKAALEVGLCLLVESSMGRILVQYLLLV